MAVSLLVVAAATVPATPAAAADVAPSRAAVFTKGYDTTKVVTLSFDTDWRTGTAAENAQSARNVATVQQILASNGITAGFGMTGRYVQQNPGEARSVVAAGHKLINHSYSHPDFMTLTRAQRFSQLDRAESAYRAAGLTSAGWLRTPYRSGYLDAALNRDLAARGYYVNFDWTFDTTGYRGSAWSVISSRIDAYTVPGAIIVMHVSYPSTDPANLQRIIDRLRGKGYAFASAYQATTTGAIRARYLAMGGATSALGAPVTGQLVATTSGTAVQWFQGGRLYWRTGTTPVHVHGGILARYRAMGTVTSLLRFPTTDERAAAAGGRYNDFQGGSIYFSGATGAHEVHGAIRAKWLALGGAGGFLGYPRSDEVAVTRGRASQFQGGNVYFSAASNAHEVHGAILARYLNLGGTGSRLGLPVTDEFSVPIGRRSTFQHGAITWNRSTGTTTVTYA